MGGRVSYAQPRDGFRSGIEPVLLAAAIAARPGQRVIEAGTGAGAALLCLAARVPGIVGVGVERDPAMAALARANATRNGFDQLAFLTADIGACPASGGFDHGFANPPYHPPAGTPSPIAAKAMAKIAPAGLFAVWAASLGAMLRRRGTLTLIVPASAVPDCLLAMDAAGCPAAVLLPLWPKPERAAKLVLLRGVKDGRSGLKLHAGLLLHTGSGGFTAAADAILRDGAALEV